MKSSIGGWRDPERGAPPWASLLVSGVAVILVGFFFGLALFRRLNFDEALALRAGWLLVQGIPGEPALFMPTTYLLGLLGSFVEDPAVVFTVARLFAVTSVLTVFSWAAVPLLRSRLEIALATVLLLAQGAFVVHGLEFRYDWALLVGWMIGIRLTLRARESPSALGWVSAWLALHHLKGLFLGGALLVVATVWLMRSTERPNSTLVRLGGGFLAGALAWMLFALASGHFSAMVSYYWRYLRLTRTADFGLTLWEALGETIVRDAGWWIVASVAVLVLSVRLVRAGSAEDAPELWVLLFALIPLGYLPLHPRPWPYMLALPAPFLAILMVRFFLRESSFGRIALRLGVALAVGLMCWTLLGSAPWEVYVESLRAPRDRQVQTLRLLRHHAGDQETILDPSGMAYFLPPCTDEWYLDSLFRLRAYRGDWMSGLATIDPASCDWMLNTYRLRWLPPDLAVGLTSQFTLIPGGGGLALPADDARIGAVSAAGLDHVEIESFW